MWIIKIIILFFIMVVYNVFIKIYLILNVVGYIVLFMFIYEINVLFFGVNNVC